MIDSTSTAWLRARRTRGSLVGPSLMLNWMKTFRMLFTASMRAVPERSTRSARTGGTFWARCTSPVSRSATRLDPSGAQRKWISPIEGFLPQ